MDSIPNHSNPIEKEKPHLLQQKQTLDYDHVDVESGNDGISCLPDEILCRFLSLLPTHDAATTTTLSTRWKPLFPSIPNLRLDLSDSLLVHPNNEGGNSRFINFMLSLLNVILRDVDHIESFKLRCKEDYGNAHLSTWINATSRFNIQNICISVANEDFLVFPRHFLGCQTLVTLGLTGRFILEYCEFRNLQVLDISNPLLKLLIISRCSHHSAFEFVLDTPVLKVLLYRGYVAEAYVVKDLNCLDVANLAFELNDEQSEEDTVRYEQNIAQFVASCANAKHLLLHEDSMQAIYQFHQLMPTFCNLIELILDAVDYYGWNALPHLLENATNLEVLVFRSISEYDGFAEFVSRLTDHLPMCFSRLRQIEFRKFIGEEDELEMVEYFLKSARVLTMMQISCDLSSEERLSLSTKLLMFPRSSPTCKILLT